MVIVDCGVGNLFSLSCALGKVGLDATIFSASQNLKDADAIVLPGVGNFRAGSRNLRILRQDIVKLVESGVALLGVCLGMQLLFEKSEESPGEGIGLIKGSVLKLPKQVKTPHMGWNTLRFIKTTKLLDGIDEKDFFYFVHSYYPSPVEKDVVAAETEYGLSFVSVIAKGNVHGTQFHPEKSGKPGKQVLRNFARFIRR